MYDFEVINCGSVWQIKAVSEAAQEFAADNFEVSPWQGTSSSFTADWRPARELVLALDAEGFTIHGVPTYH